MITPESLNEFHQPDMTCHLFIRTIAFELIVWWFSSGNCGLIFFFNSSTNSANIYHIDILNRFSHSIIIPCWYYSPQVFPYTTRNEWTPFVITKTFRFNKFPSNNRIVQSFTMFLMCTRYTWKCVGLIVLLFYVFTPKICLFA